MRITVVGGSGFVGTHLVPRLASNGHAVTVLARHPERVPREAGVTALTADVVRGTGLAEGLAQADAVVHLVAIPRARHRSEMVRVNVEGTRKVLEAAAAQGVRRFVHLSALGVEHDPRLVFLSSKWQGEQLVTSSGLDWVVLRPSVLFGQGDGFFRLIKQTLTWWSPGVIVIPGDGSARFQPLSVDDLALGIEQCLVERRHVGRRYELGGPEYLTYRDIVRAVMAVTGKHRLMLDLPVPLLAALTTVTDQVLPFFPVSHDQIGSLRTNNFARLDEFERVFGRAPRRLDLAYLR